MLLAIKEGCGYYYRCSVFTDKNGVNSRDDELPVLPIFRNHCRLTGAPLLTMFYHLWQSSTAVWLLLKSRRPSCAILDVIQLILPSFLLLFLRHGTVSFKIFLQRALDLTHPIPLQFHLLNRWCKVFIGTDGCTCILFHKSFSPITSSKSTLFPAISSFSTCFYASPVPLFTVHAYTPKPPYPLHLPRRCCSSLHLHGYFPVLSPSLHNIPPKLGKLQIWLIFFPSQSSSCLHKCTLPWSSPISSSAFLCCHPAKVLW